MPPKRQKKSLGAAGSRALGQPDRHFKTLLGSLSQFQGRGNYTDLVLRAEDGEVECHKAMLAPFSPLLRELFQVSQAVQAADTTAISLAEVGTRELEALVTFVYTGELPAGGRQGVAELARHLQMSVELGEGGGGVRGGGGAKPSPMDTAKGASWSDFIAENGASPSLETPPARKRGRQAKTPASAPAPAPALAIPTTVTVTPARRRQEAPKNAEEQEAAHKARAEAARVDIRLKNLTKDDSAEVRRYRSLEAVEEATMMEAALRKGSKGRRSKVEQVEEQVEPVKAAEPAPSLATPRRGKPAVKESSIKKNPVKEVVKTNGSGVYDSDGSDGIEILEEKTEAAKGATEEPKSGRKKGKRKAEEASTSPVIQPAESATKKGRKKKVAAEEEEVEYEVERIEERREVAGVEEFKVKWKGWEREEDRTWEPRANLKGSEKLIKKYEAEEKKKERETEDEDDKEEGVALCDVCNRIFLSRKALKDHAKEHKGRKSGATPAKSQPKRSLPPPADKVKEVKETPSRKRKRNSKEQLTNSKGELDISEVVETVHSEVEEVVEDSTGDPFAGISDPFESYRAPTPPGRAPTPPPPKYRPGPKSRKQKLLVTPPKATPPPFRNETHDAEDDEEVVNLSDSDEDSAPAAAKPAGAAPTFDDLFGGGKVFNMAPAAQPVVFNKDSDDEGEAMESVAASVGELLGDSDDDIFS